MDATDPRELRSDKSTDDAGDSGRRLRLVDAHSDFLCDVYDRRRRGETRVMERLYLPTWRAGHLRVVVAAIYLETFLVPHLALETALEMIDGLNLEIEESPGLFALCRTAAQLDRALEQGRVAVLLSLEGAEPIGTNLSLLRTLHALGVRLMGLTWSRRNAAADGAATALGGRRSPAGLTAFGRELVAEAVRLGMAVDISHLNDAGMADLLTLGVPRLFASHSNARALLDKERNIPDDWIRSLAARGGVIGINGVNTLTAADDADATVERVADHVEHIAAVAGRAHVGLGLDFCADLPEFGPQRPLQPGERAIMDILGDHAGVSALLQELKARGWPESDIRNVAGENFLRFFRTALPRK